MDSDKATVNRPILLESLRGDLVGTGDGNELEPDWNSGNPFEGLVSNRRPNVSNRVGDIESVVTTPALRTHVGDAPIVARIDSIADEEEMYMAELTDVVERKLRTILVYVLEDIAECINSFRSIKL